MLNEVLDSFIFDSYKMLIESEYEKKRRYFHSLMPGDNNPFIVHNNTNQLTYVIKGHGKVILNGSEQLITKGSSLFIKAGTVHSFTAEVDELVLFHVHIPDEGREKDRFIIQGDDYERYTG